MIILWPEDLVNFKIYGYFAKCLFTIYAEYGINDLLLISGIARFLSTAGILKKKCGI